VRVTVCELPHEPAVLASAWADLCRHTSGHRSELVLLPEFALIEPVWEEEHFDQARWTAALARSDAWIRRLSELGATYVAGTRPSSVNGRPFNQGFLWSVVGGLIDLRRKFFLPDEPGGREARWFDRGDSAFPAYRAGALRFGLNICTELWALETYGDYAREGVQVILSPRATAAATTTKWLSVGVAGAVRSGAFSVSSNRVDPTGTCGGVGWILNPQGKILAMTSAESPFATVDIDLAASVAAQLSYPCSVLR
jgi:N-carbamoylputrescine amidase